MNIFKNYDEMAYNSAMIEIYPKEDMYIQTFIIFETSFLDID